jgi:hypothetical protein
MCQVVAKRTQLCLFQIAHASTGSAPSSMESPGPENHSYVAKQKPDRDLNVSHVEQAVLLWPHQECQGQNLAGLWAGVYPAAGQRALRARAKRLGMKAIQRVTKAQDPTRIQQAVRLGPVSANWRLRNSATLSIALEITMAFPIAERYWAHS